MEQITPDLSTAYHALLTEIHSPHKTSAEPLWEAFESDYLDDSDSASVESDETVACGFDQSLSRPSPPPPSPDMDHRLHFLRDPDSRPKTTDTPSTSPLFIILDMLDIMLDQAQAQQKAQRPQRQQRPPRANGTPHREIQSDMEASCDRVEERLHLHRSRSQSGPLARRRHHRLRPSRRSVPALAFQEIKPQPESGLGPVQLTKMIDILMTEWPMVESAVLTALHQNPGDNINKCIQLLGNVLLNRVAPK
ncbi:hypothetical protein BFW01_g10663 [Lasiodiplodia theobromae]|uniref:Uncharacterized protein n=1 Tax=Lasiodiplodia theobromae TaxID=45133 RepID=A0A5N5DUH7_9PEZI|nr:uncharacterized protein LTHEOB_9739 [Lasiodiplodia theobromae]KAB2581051.1 hypothetical protein DBV05_g272 [Lasiodiplodia theobromae]KAF4539927.1 hypothetical protein LTHEOB_9739 [Lasiodiplodia theobromae]KAF9629460.1 hypothetical protein BFW01_g10663 [Lasiodiplodia theobromae]